MQPLIALTNFIYIALMGDLIYQNSFENEISNNYIVDTFDGVGALDDYVVNNPNSLPIVEQLDGRYRAELVDNTNNITLHFNTFQGRLDAKEVTFPFNAIVRNIGIGTLMDSQTPPDVSGDPYTFSGIQVHVLDLESRDSSHVVVGHRGSSTPFTIEGKNTVNINGGDSTVNDQGSNVVPDGRADIRIVGNSDRSLTVYWQLPNLNIPTQSDNWLLYRGTGQLPGAQPNYGASVYIGLITYAFEQGGIPFVGTADSFEISY